MTNRNTWQQEALQGACAILRFFVCSTCCHVLYCLCRFL